MTLAGDADGGGGSYGWSLLGSVGGTLTGVLLVAGASEISGDASVVWGAVLLGMGSQVAGSILGYELSSAGNARGQRERAMQLTPTMALDEHGGTVGIAWRF